MKAASGDSPLLSVAGTGFSGKLPISYFAPVLLSVAHPLYHEMAVIDEFEVTITSGGHTLQEHDVATNDRPEPQEGNQSSPVTSATSNAAVILNKKVSKYVEAVPGAHFAIQYSLQGNRPFDDAHSICFNTVVDGQAIDSPGFPQALSRPDGKLRAIREGSLIRDHGRLSMHRFRWEQLLTSR